MKHLVFVLVLLSAVNDRDLPSRGESKIEHASNRCRAVPPRDSTIPAGLTFGSRRRPLCRGRSAGRRRGATTAAQCEQVPAPVGPYSGGFSRARISKKSIRQACEQPSPRVCRRARPVRCLGRWSQRHRGRRVRQW